MPDECGMCGDNNAKHAEHELCLTTIKQSQGRMEGTYKDMMEMIGRKIGGKVFYTAIAGVFAFSMTLLGMMWTMSNNISDIKVQTNSIGIRMENQGVNIGDMKTQLHEVDGKMTNHLINHNGGGQ